MKFTIVFCAMLLRKVEEIDMDDLQTLHSGTEKTAPNSVAEFFLLL